jgi:hypothetical protein
MAMCLLALDGMLARSSGQSLSGHQWGFRVRSSCVRVRKLLTAQKTRATAFQGPFRGHCNRKAGEVARMHAEQEGRKH